MATHSLLTLLLTLLLLLTFTSDRQFHRSPTAVAAAAPPPPPSPSPPACEALQVSGFEVNDWINTWVVFWKRNATCSEALMVAASTAAAAEGSKRQKQKQKQPQEQRACFTKPLDALPWLRRLLERLPYFPKSNLNHTDSAVGYLLYSSEAWYISSRLTSPEGSIYAMASTPTPASTSRPPSGLWKVYNGSTLVETKVSFTCVAESFWLVLVGDALIRAGPAVFLGVFVIFLLSAVYDILLTRRYNNNSDASSHTSVLSPPPRSALPVPSATATTADAVVEKLRLRQQQQQQESPTKQGSSSTRSGEKEE